MKNYYSILQLAPTATQPEIKRAYRKLVKMHHPDVAVSTGAASKAAVSTTAVSSIQEINEAYRVLSNPAKRQAYDWKLFGAGEEEESGPTIHYAPAGKRPAGRRPTERDLVAPYIRYVYPILKISLAFCLLLLLDYALPLRKKIDQTKYIIEVYAEEYRAKAAMGARKYLDHSQVHTFSGRVINIPASAGPAFAEQSNLLIFHTPIFRKAVYVAPAKAQRLRYRIGSSIYGNFAFIPLLLLFLSGIGLYKGVTPELRFSMGVSAVVFLLISIGLLVV